LRNFFYPQLKGITVRKTEAEIADYSSFDDMSRGFLDFPTPREEYPPEIVLEIAG